MTEQQDTVLPSWARDADGGSHRFTGEDIYNRGGRWGMDRLKRDIPMIIIYYCRVPDRRQYLYFTVTLAVVPERAVPLSVRLRRPDEMDTLGGWVLLAYKSPEDARPSPRVGAARTSAVRRACARREPPGSNVLIGDVLGRVEVHKLARRQTAATLL